MGQAMLTVHRVGKACAECYGRITKRGKCEFDGEHKGYIENEPLQIEVEVNAWYSNYYPGYTWGRPEDCYPAYGGDLLGMEAVLDGELFELTDEERQEANIRCWRDELRG